MTQRYLLDSNVFIRPCRSYYPFDFAMNFWEQLKIRLQSAQAGILDVVYDEVIRGDDQLAGWLKNVQGLQKIPVQDTVVLKNYSEVLSYVAGCGFYKKQALDAWAEISVADPWLIAAARAMEAVIITEESARGSLSTKNPSKSAKIPDVAAHFNVQCEDIFYFMRQTGFRL